jgi:Protein of unknown function (DUF3500)
MKTSVSIFFLAIGFTLMSLSTIHDKKPKQKLKSKAKIQISSNIVSLAEAFKATLTADQATQLQLEYSKTNAEKWSNFPEFRPYRVGLKMATLTEVQQKAFKTMMSAVLSTDSEQEGYAEIEAGRTADDFFGEKTGKSGMFNSGNYFVAFLGKPSNTDLWELQFGGHHFAFANTYNKGKIVGATPSFRGLEPSTFEYKGKKYQPLEQEREAFAQIITELNDQEKSKAKLAYTFNDMILGPNQDGKFPKDPQGVKVGSLTKKQQQLVIKAIETYVNDLDTETAKMFMKKYTEELANTYVAYSGSGNMAQVSDYIRIDGPSIWIEYSAQPSRDFPGTSHPHSVWRDRVGDYGGN